MARPPKKSETLEIRIPYATKQALMARCRADGKAASEIVRAYIDRYLASQPRSNGLAAMSAHLMGMVRSHGRRAVALAAALMAVAGVGLAVSPATAARPDVDATFQRLDADHDGKLDIGEFERFLRP